MPLDAIILDYNGTLTDDLRLFTQAVNLFLAEHAIAPASEEDVACYDGNIPAFYERRKVPLPPHETRQRVWNLYGSIHHQVQLRDGARELLQRTQVSKWLVSKHPASLADKEFDILGIRHYFEGIYTGVSNKAAVIERICQQRKIPPAQMIKIGDRWEDITEAKKAGIKTMGIVGYHPRHILASYNPDYLVDSLHEAHACLQELYLTE